MVDLSTGYIGNLTGYSLRCLAESTRSRAVAGRGKKIAVYAMSADRWDKWSGNVLIGIYSRKTLTREIARDIIVAREGK